MLLFLACTTTPADTPLPVTEADADTDSDTDADADADTDADTDVDTSPVEIAPDDPALHYTGRIPVTASGASMYWPGSSVSFFTDAPAVTAHLSDPLGGNYLAVVVDGGEPVVVGGVKGASSVVVAEGLTGADHHIELFKRTEGWEEAIVFEGLTLPMGGSIEAVPEPTLRMEFYGDSITSGYSVDCTCDDGAAIYKNHYETYAAITARTLGAEHHSISLSGVGITQSWWEGTMLDYWDSVGLDDGAWDFADWPADIVVINLGQNDYWIGAGAELEWAYVGFIGQIREVHEDAAIFLVLGSMDATASGSPLPDYVRGAVETMNERGDERVFSHIFPYVAGGHPVASVQADMATQLVAVIEDAMPELKD